MPLPFLVFQGGNPVAVTRQELEDCCCDVDCEEVLRTVYKRCVLIGIEDLIGDCEDGDWNDAQIWLIAQPGEEFKIEEVKQSCPGNPSLRITTTAENQEFTVGYEKGYAAWWHKYYTLLDGAVADSFDVPASTNSANKPVEFYFPDDCDPSAQVSGVDLIAQNTVTASGVDVEITFRLEVFAGDDRSDLWDADTPSYVLDSDIFYATCLNNFRKESYLEESDCCALEPCLQCDPDASSCPSRSDAAEDAPNIVTVTFEFPEQIRTTRPIQLFHNGNGSYVKDVSGPNENADAIEYWDGTQWVQPDQFDNDIFGFIDIDYLDCSSFEHVECGWAFINLYLEVIGGPSYVIVEDETEVTNKDFDCTDVLGTYFQGALEVS